MLEKKIELIVQKVTDSESAIADGYIKKKNVSLKGLFNELTLKVIIDGDPKAVNKALKTLKITALDKKCTIVFHEHVNPQTTLDEQLDLEDEDEDP